MPWPQATDYTSAVQNPGSCFTDPALAGATAEFNPILGIPLSYCGNFAIVFKLVAPSGEAWAVKCFIREVTDHQTRYAHISRHLEQSRKRFAVQFDYQEHGILIGGVPHPLVKMAWVEGHTLNEFLRDHAGSANTLDQLSQLWLRLAGEMRDAKMAHGDLQHGNVLLVPGKTAGAMVLRLVDYDGMWVPELEGRPPGERGHAHYQHPERLKAGGYSSEIDRFAHLVIYTSLRSLAAGGKALWDRHDNGENLLFREADFARPEKSKLLPQLLALPDANAATLAGHLICASQSPLARVPLLTDIVDASGVQPLTNDQRDLLGTLFPDVTAFRKAAPPPPVPAPPPPPPPPPPPMPKSRPVIDLPPDNVPAPAGGGVARPPSKTDIPPMPVSAAVPLLEPLDPPPPPPPVMAAVALPDPPPLPSAASAVKLPPEAYTDPAHSPRSDSNAVIYAVLGGVAALVLLLGGVAAWLFLAPKPARTEARLTEPAAAVFKAGGEKVVRVQVRWEGTGPIPEASLTLQGAPAGVEAEVIGEERPGEREAVFLVRLRAARGVGEKAGALEALLVADGATLARVPARYEVQAFRARMGDMAPMTLRAGTSADQTAILTCDGEMPALSPMVTGLPANVTAGPHTFGKDGKLVLPIVTTRAAAAGQYPVTVQMVLEGQEAARGSFVLTVVVPKDDPPPPTERKLQMTGAESLKVVAGKSESGLVRLTRTNVEGAVTLRAGGTLPAGVKVEPVQIAGDSGRYVVEADAAAVPGRSAFKLQAYQGGEMLAAFDVMLEVEKPAAVVVMPPKDTLPKPKVLAFQTGDGLSLEGRLWPARSPKDALTVLILPDPRRPAGLDATVTAFAESLQKEGHAVFAFDFRGQGVNKFRPGDLPNRFYNASPANATLLKLKMPKAKGPPPGLERLPALYIPWLVQDVIAARHRLDTEHDAGRLNTNNLYVIGLGEGAQIAALWILAEGHRSTGAVLAAPGSDDIKAVALVGVPAMGTSPWLTSAPHYKALKLVKSVPTVAAVTDAGGGGGGRFLADQVRRKGDKPVNVALGPGGLLGHNLLAHEPIQERLRGAARALSGGKLTAWAGRDYEITAWSWYFGAGFRNVETMKPAKADTPRLFPLQRFGFSSLAAPFGGVGF